MPLSKQITETIHVEEEVIERIPITTYVEKKKIIQDQELAQQLIDQGFKKVTSSLPLDCGVTSDMIPKYCYYKPETDKKGGKFIIERHPKLVEKGVRQWATTESKSKTVKEKFNLLLEKLKELEKYI